MNWKFTCSITEDHLRIFTDTGPIFHLGAKRTHIYMITHDELNGILNGNTQFILERQQWLAREGLPSYFKWRQFKDILNRRWHRLHFCAWTKYNYIEKELNDAADIWKLLQLAPRWLTQYTTALLGMYANESLRVMCLVQGFSNILCLI